MHQKNVFAIPAFFWETAGHRILSCLFTSSSNSCASKAESLRLKNAFLTTLAFDWNNFAYFAVAFFKSRFFVSHFFENGRDSFFLLERALLPAAKSALVFIDQNTDVLLWSFIAFFFNMTRPPTRLLDTRKKDLFIRTNATPLNLCACKNLIAWLLLTTKLHSRKSEQSSFYLSPPLLPFKLTAGTMFFLDTFLSIFPVQALPCEQAGTNCATAKRQISFFYTFLPPLIKRSIFKAFWIFSGCADFSHCEVKSALCRTSFCLFLERRLFFRAAKEPLERKELDTFFPPRGEKRNTWRARWNFLPVPFAVPLFLFSSLPRFFFSSLFHFPPSPHSSAQTSYPIDVPHKRNLA